MNRVFGALIGAILLSMATPAAADHHWAKLHDIYVVQEADGKCGYISAEGEYIIPATFDRANGFELGLASVTIGRDTHFIDASGSEVFSLNDRARSFGFDERSGLAKVETRTGEGYVDEEGVFVVPPVYYELGDFGDNDRTSGEIIGTGHVVMDKAGTVQFGPVPGAITIGEDGKIRVWNSERQAADFYDANYRLISNFERPLPDRSAQKSGRFKRVNVWHDSGYATAQEKGAVGYADQWGIINRNLDWVVPPVYDLLYFNLGPNELTFIHGRRDGLWGFVDIAGVEVVPFHFDRILPFVGDYAPAAIGEKWGLIDKKGQWVLQPAYDAVKELSGRAVAVEEGNLWGVVNYAGEWLIEPRFVNVDYCQGPAYSYAEHTFRDEDSQEVQNEERIMIDMLRALDATEQRTKENREDEE